jgi:uncharacterized membrane protein YheB (UPF0754 family)
VTAPNACVTTKQKTKTLTAQVAAAMSKPSDLDTEKKRQKVQAYFWNIVGSVEHINVPKLEDALKKEFHTQDHRFIEQQIRLMQSEGRIKVQSNHKVWIRQPKA